MPDDDSEPDDGTESAPDGKSPIMPVAARWAMRDRQHSFRRHDPSDPRAIDARLGSGDSEVFAIDDGDDHCMVARVVGTSEDGCTYCLVGRVSFFDFVDLRDATVALEEAFTTARDLALCGVFESDVHSPVAAPNVFVVQHYRSARDVPEEYLPPSPFIAFTDS